MSEENKDLIVCSYCPSKILLPGKGKLQISSDFNLPPVTPKDAPEELHEKVTESLMVKDMYDFENVGFSKTVGNIKYLTCADCEIGPIGWHCLDTKMSYLALSRVKQVSSQ